MSTNPLAGLESMMNGVQEKMNELANLKAQLSRMEQQQTAAVSTERRASPDAYQRIMNAYGRTQKGQEQMAQYNAAFTKWLEEKGHAARFREETERLKSVFENENQNIRDFRIKSESDAFEYAESLAARMESETASTAKAPPRPRKTSATDEMPATNTEA